MRKLFLLTFLLVGASGCASYSTSFTRIEILLEQQKPQDALLELEQHPRTGTDKLLHLLDKAMLQRMSGLYEESNATFELAKKHIESLQGTSIIEQAGALTINDSAMSYEGDDFEQVSIHVYGALNYIALGLWDEARVETLQVDALLNAKAVDDQAFEEDAFSRYLSGLIYEFGGEFDNAMIAYRKAYEAYQQQQKTLGLAVPELLKSDLLRLSKKLGLTDEFRQFQEIFKRPEKVDVAADNKRGEVVVMLHHGLAPIKRSVSLLVATDAGVPTRISLPEYQSRPSYVYQARLTVGELSVDASLVNDIDAMARASLEAHKAAMIARLIARAVLKKAISDGVNKEAGDLAGFMMDMVAMATETADTRSWLTLPKNIYLSRLAIAPGTYPASLALFDAQGLILTTFDLGELEIDKGKKVFIEKTFTAPARIVKEK